MNAAARRSAVPWLVAIAGYAALTLIFTWPLAAHLSALLPHDLGDPILNTWILWWNAHSVPLTARWWNARMFWPLDGALGLSEHLLGLSLVATPMQWLGADPVTAYNIVFLVSFPLCAIAAHALALEDGEVEALDQFAATGPLTVVVDTRRDDRQWKRLSAHAAGTPVDGGQGRLLYTLPQFRRDEREPSGERLRIQSAAASSPAFDLSTLTDGDPISHWDSGSPQRGHEWIVLDMGKAQRFEALMLGIGPYFAGYPRQLAIDGSPDGQRWTPLFEGRSAWRAVDAARRNPREVAFTFAFAPTDARWIRLRQLGYADEAHWIISELAVLGR